MTNHPAQAFNLRGSGEPEVARIYLDHNATTPLASHLPEYLTPLLSAWGNPSSIHMHGRGPKALLREARQNLAKMVGATPLELIFTSGGSESNNLAIKGFVEATRKTHGADIRVWPRNEFITTQVEHPSVTKTFRFLEAQGAVVHYLKVDREGRLDRETYSRVLSDKTALVSMMAANNETGTLFPIQDLCREAHARGARFHTDAVQTLGKIAVRLNEWGVDYASFASHKFYSLKGSGMLFVKKGAPIDPLIHGGNQERGRRAGTENTLAIACFGEMSKQMSAVEERAQTMARLRDAFEIDVLKRISDVKVTAGTSPRLANTSSLVIAGVDGESLLMNLDMHGISVSTGAACSSGNPEPSPVLLAMGISRAEAQASLRVSLGWGTTEQEMKFFGDTLVQVVAHLRRLREEYQASQNQKECSL